MRKPPAARISAETPKAITAAAAAASAIRAPVQGSERCFEHQAEDFV